MKHVLIGVVWLVTSAWVPWYQGQSYWLWSSAPPRLDDGGELIVLTRYAPTTFYIGRDDDPSGPELELVRSFADFLGVGVRFQIYDNVAEVLTALRDGQGHIAAAGLPRDWRTEAGHLSGPVYQQVSQQLVCRRGGAKPTSVTELDGIDIAVIGGSAQEQTLSQLREQYPRLRWMTSNDLDTELLLEQVWQRRIDCTVADSNTVAINRRYYPELEPVLTLTPDQPLAWAVTASSPELIPALETWLESLRVSDTLADITGRYYGFIDDFDYVDTKVFQRRIEERLPRFRSLFEQAARQTGLPWTLLAAVSYQESHWDPDARSYTGVRGLMMMTRATASDMNIDNRLDPAQSVKGGSAYLRQLLDRVPESITDPDERLWNALAAYNLGIGHLYDARQLARQLGRDPDRWLEFQQVLPLLAHRRHYRQLTYGYARGYEAVHYVRRIRDFQDMLEQAVIAPRSDPPSVEQPVSQNLP